MWAGGGECRGGHSYENEHFMRLIAQKHNDGICDFTRTPNLCGHWKLTSGLSERACFVDAAIGYKKNVKSIRAGLLANSAKHQGVTCAKIAFPSARESISNGGPDSVRQNHQLAPYIYLNIYIYIYILYMSIGTSPGYGKNESADGNVRNKYMKDNDTTDKNPPEATATRNAWPLGPSREFVRWSYRFY